jgi:hypothetical protein
LKPLVVVRRVLSTVSLTRGFSCLSGDAPYSDHPVTLGPG